MSAADVLILVVVGASTWPVWRFARWSFRRGRSLGTIALVIATIGSIVGTGVALTAGLPALVVLAVLTAVWVWLACRRRPTWGRRRGLPPGPLRWLDTTPVDEQATIAELFRRHGPVVKMGNTLPVRRLRPTVCIAGLDRGVAVVEGRREDLLVPALPSHEGVPLGFLRIMDGEVHERYEPIISGALGITRETLRDDATRRAVDERLEASPATWHPRDIASPLVHDVFRRTMLGLRPGSELAARLDAALAGVQRHDRRWMPVPLRRRAYDVAIGLLLDHESELDGDAVLVDALRRGRAAGLDDTAIVGNLLQMFTTGGQDCTGLLSWTWIELARRPDHQVRLRTAISAGDTHEVVAYVREVLRLHQSEYLLRVTRRPITVDGHRIPAGWLIRICVAESHRDPAVFDRPEEILPDRFLHTPPQRPTYMPFGNGAHRCLGSGVAITVVATATEELLRGWELRMVGDAPNRHDSSHWVPGDGVRLSLVPHPRS